MMRISIVTAIGFTLMGPTLLRGPELAHAQQKVSIPTLTPPSLPAFLRKCDMVVDVSAGRVIRLNHVDDPKTTPESVRAYLGSCPSLGANYAFNPAARANAVEKVHDFLKQYLQIPG